MAPTVLIFMGHRPGHPGRRPFVEVTLPAPPLPRLLVVAVILLASLALALPAPAAPAAGGVPGLIGLTPQAAEAKLKQSGHQFQKALGDPAPSLDKLGLVYWQNPPAGAVIPRDRVVGFRYHQGSPDLGRGLSKTPAVTNMHLGAARWNLDTVKLGVVVKPGRQVAEAARHGFVYQQFPKPGDPLPADRRVQVWVHQHQAKDNVKVPLLLGQGPEQARQALTHLGLVATVVVSTGMGLVSDVVLRQEPAADTLVPRGSPVCLVIHRKTR